MWRKEKKKKKQNDPRKLLFVTFFSRFHFQAMTMKRKNKFIFISLSSSSSIINYCIVEKMVRKWHSVEHTQKKRDKWNLRKWFVTFSGHQRNIGLSFRFFFTLSLIQRHAMDTKFLAMTQNEIKKHTHEDTNKCQH